MMLKEEARLRAVTAARPNIEGQMQLERLKEF
jgi:hypothetical protein